MSFAFLIPLPLSLPWNTHFTQIYASRITVPKTSTKLFLICSLLYFLVNSGKVKNGKVLEVGSRVLIQFSAVITLILYFKNWGGWDFHGGPVVKNLFSSTGDMGSIPGRGTKIPHAMVQLSPCPAREPTCHKYWAWMLWSPCSAKREATGCHKTKLTHCNEDPAWPKKGFFEEMIFPKTFLLNPFACFSWFNKIFWDHWDHALKLLSILLCPPLSLPQWEPCIQIIQLGPPS